MNAIQRFFFNLFICCCGLGFVLFSKIDSYALDNAVVSFSRPDSSYSCEFGLMDGFRYAIYYDEGSQWYLGNTYFYTNNDVVTSYNLFWVYPGNSFSVTKGLSVDSTGRYILLDNNGFPSSNLPFFTDRAALKDYLDNGTLPELPFDSTLELDSFVVNTYGNVLDDELVEFTNYFVCNWSDDRIATVRVRVDSSRLLNDFTSSVTPFTQSFNASDYASVNGDVITLTATPYNSNGGYGPSLYYSFVYNGNSLIHNIWRKFVNTDKNRNVIDIPYNSVPKAYPVDGVTTNYNYKVNYNPVTNEYGDLNLYEIYYSPVIMYPDDTPSEEITDTQEQVVNYYTTNNYYETTKNINLDFDIDFGDISTNDIGEGFNGVTGFFNGFGSLIGRLSNWILALFPFLPPIVANSIVFMFGLVILIAGIALILKIIGAIGNIIDAILPL